MSHISKIELEVKDLAILKMACDRLGLELMQGKTEFRWYGNNAKCHHAIRVPGAGYEIGVQSVDGRYELQCDYYDPNIGKAIGQNGGLLKQAYAVEKTRSEARRNGYTVIEKKTEDRIRLHVRM